MAIEDTAAPEAATPPRPRDATAGRVRDPVPAIVWGAAAITIVLRSLPFWAIVTGAAPAGQAAVPAPYIPRDWLAYVSLIRQGWGPFSNPFTTQPQDERILMLFHQLLGGLHRLTGADPFLLLELSRVVALLGFTTVLWGVTGALYAARRERVWACWLVLLSGGLGFLARAAQPLLPKVVADAIAADLWTAYGWSTFEAAFNPLWVTGLALTLWLIRILAGNETPAPRGLASLILLLLWFSHPYSGVAALAAVAGGLVSRWISGEPAVLQQARRLAGALAPALLVIALVTLWQRGDPAFRAASGFFFGHQATSPAWYPITLAAVGFFALRGLRELAATGHPWRHALAGWVGAVALLHSSTVINGYHFLFPLHLPLALLAAGPSARWLGERTGAPARTLAAGGLLLLLFTSPIVTTLEDTGQTPYLSAEALQLIRTLGEAPPGKVFAPTELGNVIPAYGRHQVWVGHWFMTPDYVERSLGYVELTRNPSRVAELAALVRREDFDYLVVPSPLLPHLQATGLAIGSHQAFGAATLVALAPGPEGPRATPP
jgi:hypothetical protein